jgi:hypothetical protein
MKQQTEFQALHNMPGATATKPKPRTLERPGGFAAVAFSTHNRLIRCN